MKEFKFLTHNTYNRTKSWITALYTFIFVFAYFLIIWILFGEFNVLKFNFLLFPDSNKHFDPSEGWVTNNAQISDQILLFLFVPGFFYILSIALIHYLFKQTAWDMIPIVFSFWFAFITLILSGTFANPWSIWVLIGRIILIATVFFLSFFVLNSLINFLISRSSLSSSFFSSALNQEIIKKQNFDNLKSLNQENQKEIIIDVLAENIFLKNKKTKQQT